MIPRFNQDKSLLKTLIGKPLKEAREMAAFNGYSTRISRKDNERFILTHDLHFDRINFEVDNDIITKASIG